MTNYETVVATTNDFLNDFTQDGAWKDSPFAWIRSLPPASKGVVGRAIASSLLQANGLTVYARRTQLRVNAQGILVRVALMWKEGILKFQNVREPDFDHVLCIGLCPNEALAWLIPKDEIWQNGAVRTDKPGITAQHKGADAWLSVTLNNIQPWLKQYGGALDEMLKVAGTQL